MPKYLELHSKNALRPRAELALARLENCVQCPRRCGMNRLENERGHCQIGRRAQVASYNLHFGEEDPLVGSGGSGTIFFAGCNLSCVFCQNYDISHAVDDAIETSPEQLAGIMLALQHQGAANINFVTPTHVAAQILEALPIAAERGLTLPLVYNTSGYDALETLQLLDGVVDIYMPDLKFWDAKYAARYCQAPDYPEATRLGLREMHRQVGDLELDARGLATQGLLVRHLVMPDSIAGTAEWMDFLVREISPKTYVNIMDQYRPCGRAKAFPEIARAPTAAECHAAQKAAEASGLVRFDDRHERLAVHLVHALFRKDE